MRRTYRYPLYPTRQQEGVLLGWLHFCQQLYNAALEERIGAWKRARKPIRLYDQQRELTELRASDADASAVPVLVARSALHRLDRAFAAFFRRCNGGEMPGFPRFRSRDRYDSFGIGRVRCDGDRVLVPKLGPVKFNAYREMRGEIKDVAIRRKCGRWFVCFSCDLGDAPAKIPVVRAIGVDLGLATFAVLSDGGAIQNPRFFREGEKLLADRQRRLALKKRGSRSRQRAKLLVGKAHEHVQNQRLDFSRKLTVDLFSRFDLVAYEDLRIRNMVRSPLGKSISDAAWGIFINCLVAKAESAGRYAIAVDPRGTSQRCSGCGTVVKKELSERTHSCECGLRIGRDENAALNILALAPGRGVAGGSQ
jgi:putative transposase